MERNNSWAGILRIGVVLFLVVLLGWAGPGWGGPSKVPRIPKFWIEIDPAEVYPDFTYQGLEPSCAACPPTVDPGTGELISYDPKFTFFVKGGRQNNLVIYFQGGGACWDPVNCLYAHTYMEEVLDLDSLEMMIAFRGMGILDTFDRRNPFRKWYFVYIPYCTGDIHWGAADHEYEDTWLSYGGEPQTIRHRGFVNFQVVLKWIRDNFRGPRKIFVSGSSAGAYGAILAAPYIQEAFPHSMVYVLGDAGNGVVSEDFFSGPMQNWNPQFPTWIEGFDEPGDLTLAKMYFLIGGYYPRARLAQYTDAWDATQAWFYNLMLSDADGVPYVSQPSTWKELPYPDVWCDWHDQMRSYAHQTAEQVPNYRYYIAPGTEHTILISPSFYTEKSAGYAFRKWVKRMLKRRISRKWSNVECRDCDPPPIPCAGP